MRTMGSGPDICLPGPSAWDRLRQPLYRSRQCKTIGKTYALPEDRCPAFGQARPARTIPLTLTSDGSLPTLPLPPTPTPIPPLSRLPGMPAKRLPARRRRHASSRPGRSACSLMPRVEPPYLQQPGMPCIHAGRCRTALHLPHSPVEPPMLPPTPSHHCNLTHMMSH